LHIKAISPLFNSHPKTKKKSCLTAHLLARTKDELSLHFVNNVRSKLGSALQLLGTA